MKTLVSPLPSTAETTSADAVPSLPVLAVLLPCLVAGLWLLLR